MSCVTQVPPRFKTGFAYGTVTLYGHGFHRVPLPFSSTCWRSYNPGRALPLCRFRLLRVRSPLLAESLLFSFPAGNEMFQFPAFASFTDTDLCRWVAPFGYPRINGYLPLPAAFRSLSRPSSPPRAKASAMRPFLLLAHAALQPHAARASQPGTSYFVSMCQHVIERGAFLRLWRITDSNR